MSVNDLISQDLKQVVSNVTPPVGGKVAYISRGNGTVEKIHKDDPEGGKNSEVQFTYFVAKKELPKVQEKFLLQAPDPELISKLKETTGIPSDDDEESETEGSDDESMEGMEKTYESSSGLKTGFMNRQSSTSSTKYL